MRFWIVTLMTWLALNAPAAQALESDRDQPATIEADEVEFDFRNGTRTYKGDVVVVQGTLRITGDKLVIRYTEGDEQIETATSWGNPATFKQRPDGKDQDVYGEGNEIVLNEIDNTLTLIENAVMTQAGNTAKGNRIVYDMASDKMTVKGMRRQQAGGSEEAGGEAEETGDGRARVIITPEDQQASGGGQSGDPDSSGGDDGDEESAGASGSSDAGQGAE